MNADEVLLGFDAREMWGASDWPPERRECYLLRPDVEKVLSTDTMVWQSVFVAADIETPAWTGIIQDMWAELDLMQQYLQSVSKPYLTIAITALTFGDEDALIHAYMPNADGTQTPLGYADVAVNLSPKTLDERWSLLGYDVSDRFLLSGLSNCGCVPDEFLAPAWSAHLNDYHLFSDVERALAFRAISDARVREHAPFFVYGLYRLTSP